VAESFTGVGPYNYTWTGTNTSQHSGSTTYQYNPTVTYDYNTSSLAYEASPEGMEWMRRMGKINEERRVQQMRTHHRRKLMMARERKIAELWTREW